METINWGYVLSTLVIRFVGVFVVLALVQIGIISSSKIIYFLESRPLTKTGQPKKRKIKKGKL